MLKLKNKLITVLAIVACTLLVCSAMMFKAPVKAGASEPTLNGSTAIEESYVVGEKFIATGFNINVEGSDYVVDVVYVYTPDGMLYQVTDGYVFRQVGYHKLVFGATVADQQVMVEESVLVDNTGYSATDLTKVEYIDELSVVADNQKKGLKVTIPFTDEFKWNTPVDLSKTGTETPLLTFLPYQFSMLKAEGGKIAKQANEIYVRLTDAYDSSVYVDIRLDYLLNSGAANQMPAYSAGAARQQIRSMSPNLGRDSREGKIMFVGGERYFVTYPERGGYPYLGNATEEGCLISLYFDVKTNQVYAAQQVVGGEYTKSLVNDVDATEIYGANAFKGFTTGEVFVSIYASGYVSRNATVDMEISQIGFQTGEQLHDLTASDKVYPVIDVDLSIEQEENGLFIAKGQEVALLPARAFDVYLQDFTAEVKYNDSESVSIINGKFIPEKVGKYTITYTAVDYSGKKTEVEVVYNCEDRSANDNKLIDFEVEHYAGEKKAGYDITLPIPAISTPNKYVQLKTYAVFGEEKIEVDAETRTFKPEHVGTYKIVYEYSDIFESSSYYYEMTVEASAKVELATPALPKYILEDAYYTLDAVYVKTFEATNPEMKEVEYQVSFDGGEFATVDYANFIARDVDSVQFKYVYAGNEVGRSEVLKVVRDSFGRNGVVARNNLKNYFQGDFYTEDNTEDAGSANFRIISNATSGNTTIDFVNVVSLTNFKVVFKIPSAMSNYKSISFTLTDYLDQSKTEVITYTNTGSGTSFNVRGANQTIAASAAFANNQFELTYGLSNSDFRDSKTGAKVIWDNTFTSERILLSVTLSGITGKAGVEIVSICEQNITKNTDDLVIPVVVPDVSFQGNQKAGTTVIISPALGIDVICPTYYGTTSARKIEVTVEKMVVSAAGTKYVAMYADDNTLLNKADGTKAYELTLTEIASYRVRYKYTEQNNRSNTASYNINIVDEVKPVIAIEGGYNEYSVIGAHLGDVIKAKDYVVTDNYDTTGLEVKVVVFDPMMTMYDLIDNDFEMDDMKFTATYKGIYTVYYYVEDSSGNIGTNSYKVYVE